MLTSVLDSQRLPRAQIVRFYQLRWGIDVEFRGLKQTLDRAQLRCRKLTTQEKTQLKSIDRPITNA
jgi:hypothetical protein